LLDLLLAYSPRVALLKARLYATPHPSVPVFYVDASSAVNFEKDIRDLAQKVIYHADYVEEFE
jgi:hypothetical protein